MEHQEEMDSQEGMDCTEAMEHKEEMEQQEATEQQDVQGSQEVPLRLFMVTLLSVLLLHRYRFIQGHIFVLLLVLCRLFSTPRGQLREHSARKIHQQSKNHGRLHLLIWRLIWVCLITTRIHHRCNSLSAPSLCSTAANFSSEGNPGR
jgi:hypothetical protein